jgi:predicted kinase
MKELFMQVRKKYMFDLQKTIVPSDKYHLEGDVWSHTMLVFNAEKDGFYKKVALLHDLGKPLAKFEKNGKTFFTGHEGLSVYLACEFTKDKEVLYVVNYHGVLWQKSSKQIGEFFAKDRELLEKIKQFSEYDKAGNISFDDTFKNEINNVNFKPKKETKTKGVIHMLCGLPGSGKSTFAKNLNLPILSRDDIITDLYGDNYNEAWKKADQKLVEKKLIERARQMKSEKEFVIDMTNLSWKSRKRWFNYFKEYEFQVYFFLVPLDEIFKRNAQRENKQINKDVIVNMAKKTQLPLCNEANNMSVTLFL